MQADGWAYCDNVVRCVVRCIARFALQAAYSRGWASCPSVRSRTLTSMKSWRSSFKYPRCPTHTPIIGQCYYTSRPCGPVPNGVGSLANPRGKWDRAKWDRGNWDRAKWDRAKWDRGKWDRAKWDRAKWDRAKPACMPPAVTADGCSSLKRARSRIGARWTTFCAGSGRGCERTWPCRRSQS